LAGFVEILPRQYYGISTTVYSSVVDAGGAALAVVQGVLDTATSGTTGDEWTVTVQHSNVNEDQQFVDTSAVGTISGGDRIAFVYATQFGRYVRVKLETGSAITPGYFRGYLTLKDSN
jgi:hypothetical protein